MIFVRGSPARTQTFRAGVEKEKNSHLETCLSSCLNRWNSTYLMLEAAKNFEKTFKLLEDKDVSYNRELCGESSGALESED